MFVVDGNDIKISRGDTGSITVNLTNANGDIYELREGDELKLTVADAPSRTAAVRLVIVSDNNVLKFEPSDTVDIPVGQYSVDIQLTKVDGSVHTIFPNYTEASKLKSESNWKNFWVVPEVSL